MGISFQPSLSKTVRPGMNHPAIDPRFTFARQHVEDVCSDTSRVLAVDEIINELPSKLRESLNRRRLLEEFFFSDKPDTQVYLPVRVRANKESETPAVVGDLSKLIDNRQITKSSLGIVLSALSGAGKTVAALKAFFDCFTVPPGDKEPILAGYLPCWVRLESDAAKGTIEQIIAKTLHWPALTDSWLRHTPPMLLFFDLNAADDKVRLHVAEDLRRFQQDYAKDGHRCIVAYRSTQDNDAAMTALLSSGCFTRYDLEPIGTGTAEKYLRGIREFEAHVFKSCGQSPPKRDVDTECAHLKAMVDQHAVGSDSLISTPLLMHLASLLPPEVGDVHTLTRLYECVVKQFVNREWRNNSTSLNPLAGDEVAFRDAIVTAMVRVALVILTEGVNSTRIDRRTLDRILKRPGDDKPGPGKPRSWWPKDRFWHKSRYFKNVFAERKLRILREHSFLRGDGEAFGFLHDSFLYYFAAIALRYPEGPEMMGIDDHLADPWYTRVTERLRAVPEEWLLPSMFLGGMLDREQVRSLSGAMISAVAEPLDRASSDQLDLPDLLHNLLLGAGSYVEADPLLGPLMSFLKKELDRIREEQPSLLLQELHNYCHAPGLSEGFFNWIKVLRRPTAPLILRTSPNPYWQSCSQAELTRRREPLSSIVFSADGRSILCGSYSEIRRWNAATGVELQSFGQGPVNELGIGFRGQHVVAGFDDGTVIVRDASSGLEVKTIHEHAAPITSIWASPDSDLAVVGSTDGRVTIWDASTWCMRRYLELGSGKLWSLCYSPCLRVIAVSEDHHILQFYDVDTGHLRGECQHSQLAKFQFSMDGQSLISVGGVTVIAWDCSHTPEKVWEFGGVGEAIPYDRNGYDRLGPWEFKGVTLEDFSEEQQLEWQIDEAGISGSNDLMYERSSIMNAAMLPDSRHLLISTKNGMLHLVDTNGGVNPIVLARTMVTPRFAKYPLAGYCDYFAVWPILSGADTTCRRSSFSTWRIAALDNFANVHVWRIEEQGERNLSGI